MTTSHRSQTGTRAQAGRASRNTSEGHRFSNLARDGDTIYHCYSSYARGREFLMGNYAILDRAPSARDEGDQPMGWLRRDDEYETR